MGLAAEVEAANVDDKGCSTCATRWRLSVPIGEVVGDGRLQGARKRHAVGVANDIRVRRVVPLEVGGLDFIGTAWLRRVRVHVVG